MGELDLYAPLGDSNKARNSIHVHVLEGIFTDKLSIYVRKDLVASRKTGIHSLNDGLEISFDDERTLIVKWLYNPWRGGLPQSLVIMENDMVIAQYGNDKAKHIPINNGLHSKIPFWLQMFATITGGFVAFLAAVIFLGDEPFLGVKIAIPFILAALSSAIILVTTIDIEKSSRTKIVIAITVSIIAWIIYFIVYILTYTPRQI